MSTMLYIGYGAQMARAVLKVALGAIAALSVACADPGAHTMGSVSTALPDTAKTPRAKDEPKFVATELGGYQLGESIWIMGKGPWTEEMIDARIRGQLDSGGCKALVGVVRDFGSSIDADGRPDPDGNADFEAYRGKAPTRNLVESALGMDDKPVYASQCEAEPDPSLCPNGQQTTGETDFETWFRSIDSAPYLVYLTFAANGEVSTFDSSAYFPLDGFGGYNPPGARNFGFTTEVHTKFFYHGGEHLKFGGDDDLWVFINHKLAIDLGGVHPTESAELDLDAEARTLEIEPGHSYQLDLFHAERRSPSSAFRMDLPMAFTECGTVTPDLL